MPHTPWIRHALALLCSGAMLLSATPAIATEGARHDTPQATARANGDLAQPPEGRRLVEQRCLACHGERTIGDAGFGRLGWHLTVTRMNWVNGAGVSYSERGPIVDYLSAQSKPSMVRVIGEWVVATLLAASLAFMVWRGIRRWRARREPPSDPT